MQRAVIVIADDRGYGKEIVEALELIQRKQCLHQPRFVDVISFEALGGGYVIDITISEGLDISSLPQDFYLSLDALSSIKLVAIDDNYNIVGWTNGEDQRPRVDMTLV